MVIMTISKGWIDPHGIYRLQRRLESVKRAVTVRTDIEEYIYGLKDKEYIKILKQSLE